MRPTHYCVSTVLRPLTPNSMLRLVRSIGLFLIAGLLWAGCDSGTPPNADTGDATPTVEFAAQGATVTEGDGVGEVSVVIRNPDGEPVSVDVLLALGASSDGLEPADLNLPDVAANGTVVGTVTFPANASDGDTQTLTFDITDDEEGEEREAARFALQNVATRGAAQIGETNEFALEIGFPTLQEIRNQREGGDLVTFQATVTRARGNFTYVQDGTAGFTLRQTGGAFQADVSSGTISPGTVLQITGRISFFAGLSQINGDDLESYDILEQTDVPTPQAVTLDEVAGEVGEAFEAELIRVANLTFANAGGTFAAQTNYTVTDAAGGQLVIRIPDAADTQLVGEPIPTGTVLFEGVVGQFHGFDFNDEPDGGYQLLAIDANDIRAQ